MVIDMEADYVLIAIAACRFKVFLQLRLWGVPRHREQHVVNSAGSKCLEPHFVSNGATKLDIVLVITFQETICDKQQ